jgi:hypothetical protein
MCAELCESPQSLRITGHEDEVRSRALDVSKRFREIGRLQDEVALRRRATGKDRPLSRSAGDHEDRVAAVGRICGGRRRSQEGDGGGHSCHEDMAGWPVRL